jgi:hypothetical protein
MAPLPIAAAPSPIHPAPLPIRQVLFLLAIYLLVSIIGMAHHELWLDEAQHFLIGRDSHSLPEMYYNMRYDGHPRLWNGLLYLITHFITPSYIGMQVFHLAIAACTAFIFLRYAPFSLPVKILVLCGYYFIFEYDLISRNYAPGILLLFICCLLMRDPRKNLLWIGMLLFLMCNTHLFFAFAAMGIFFYLSWDYIEKKEWFTTRYALFAFIFLAGFICVIIQTRTPKEDNMYHVNPADWLTAKNLTFAAYAVIRGWLPIPQVLGGHFWNTSWLQDRNIGPVVRDLLFLCFIAYPAIVLQKFRRSLLFYYSSLFILVFCFVVAQMTAARYFGMVYIYFLAACWMAGNSAGDPFSLRQLPGPPVMKQILRCSFIALLVLHVLAGIFAYEQDYRRPFTQAKNAIDYIRDRGLAGEEVTVDGYNAGPMLSAYLGRPVFYLDIDQPGSWIYWKVSYFPRPRKTIEQELTACTAHLQGLDKFILISNRKLDIKEIELDGNRFEFAAVSSFENSILMSENFYTYQATRINGH